MTPDPCKGRLRRVQLGAVLLVALIPAGHAVAGVSAYLPLSLAPEIEARVERLLVLADVTVMTRPIRVTTVVEALASACPKYRSLCRQVRRDLAPYLAPIDITGIGVEAAATKSNKLTQPDQHGAPMDSSWQAYVSGIARFGEHSLLSVGAVGNSDRVTPTGTMASLGWYSAQFDVGYRDHWWSPFRLGSMLIGTEAATMPSITVSNVEPLTIAHLRYEVFIGRMSYSDRIAFNGGYTAGYPRLFGFHIDLEPAPGWTLGLSRTMQYGGGDRPSGFHDMVKAFFNPARYDNVSPSGANEEFGNEQVAFSSEFVIPVRFPMSAYIEYAAEDTFHSENYRFGSSALSAGFYLPRLLPDLQLRYEFSEWQSNWYVHHIYQDGMTNYGVVLGQWGAQWRRPGDGVGAQSHALELIWDLGGRRELDLQYRTALNASYTGGNYQRAQELAISVSRPWRNLQVGARIDGGRDEYGDSFGRLAAFARYGGPYASSHYQTSADDDTPESVDHDAEMQAAEAARRRVEGFVDLGMFSSKVDYEQDAGSVPAEKSTHGSVHLGLGVRRAVNRRNDLGVRIEFDNVDGKLLTALRAVDYRHRFGPTFAASLFFGAARYDALTPAYGWYLGAGMQWRDVWKYWDLGVDYRFGDHMVRNKTPGEPIVTWPNAFYSIQGVSTYISRRF
jgi:capsule assembly protein Wzi